MHQLAKAALILNAGGEQIKVSPSLGFNPVAPEAHQLFGGGRRCQPGQTLAHHQRHSLFQRGLALLGNIGKIAAKKPVVQHCGQIMRHTGHALRPNRLNPRLLNRVKHRPRRLALWRNLAMHRIIMAGQPQSH